ncbi:hypothetical protein PPERSA_07604 [Pseudocohnilembus persalinus]|uniref:GPI transamidase component PIG-T n=1 Tax=Pseudocohnilembus persalinus TaxID=266149 RepID=A0A0V0QIF9_PSEPJ|nr:hypothetical protein PPERSA_07604 [Pseudocohnilembus persalinus]|eukprot:KRX01959.1 hypothetical protein PPERSA_07604 [Pseudocohnilembus persalinus]
MKVISAKISIFLKTESLGEVFKLTKTTIKNQNHFQVKNNITQVQDESNIFSKDYIYSQDPTDFICVNNIEQLRIYLPCGGKKGLMSIIDQTNLFASDYISIVSDFYYDRINDQIKATIVINAIVPLQNYREFLADEKQIKLNCPVFQSSFISIDSYGILETGKISVKDFDYNVEKLFDMIDTKQNKQNIQKYKNKLADLKSNQILKSNRYMGDRWTDFQGFLVHELVNNDQKRTIQIISSEFLIWQCQPVLHQIQIIRDDLYEDKQINYTLTVEENQSYLFQFYIDIKPQEKVRIIIPMNKLMKSFENYPHDPQRGHDIISGSIVYSFKNDINDQKVKHQSSQNLLIRLPEPDFSMPFNIITYVCVLLGYVFLSIFQNSTKRPKIDQ